MRIRFYDQFCERAVLALLAFTILWKGGKTLESTWLLLGVGALCAASIHFGRRVTKERQDRLVFVIATLLLLLLWTSASMIFSSTQNYGLDELLQTGGLIFIFLWIVLREDPGTTATARTWLHRFSFVEQFFILLAFIAVLSCGVGILVYALQPVNRFVGTFFDPRFHTDYWPNAFAQFLLLAWPVTLLVSGNEIRRGGNSFPRHCAKVALLRFMPIGLVLGCLLLSYSRGAIIAFIGQIVFLIMLLLTRKAAGSTIALPLRRISLALLIGFAVFVGANELRSLLHPVQPILEKALFQAAEGRSSVDERTQFWRQSALLTAQRPLFGWGPYSFRFVQPRYQHHVLATSDHPHNVFLKYSAERGIPAMLFLTAYIGIILFAGFELSRSGKRYPESMDHVRLGYALMTTSIAGVVMHNLIDYNLQFTGIALPLWLLAALLIRQSHLEFLPLRPRIRVCSPNFLRASASIFVVVLLMVSLREGWYLVTSSAGRHAESAQDAESALRWYTQSSPEWFKRDLNLSRAHLLLQQGMIGEAEASVDAYMEGNREDARAWKLKAEIAAQQNNFDSAVTLYEEAFKRNGWNDMSISRGLLESLFASTYEQPTSDAAADSKHLALRPEIKTIAPGIEQRAREFTDAIMRNVHFIALSPNPEETVKVFIMLSVIFPEKAEEFRTLSKMIDAKALEERSRMSARSPGWLW